MGDIGSTTARILVFGATGATGRRVVEEAVRQGLAPVVGGRHREALEAVASRRDLEVRVADTDLPASLDDALDGIDVVISCVGPYTYHGRPVAEAAVRRGTGYVDVTGEAPFVAGLIEDLDKPARDSGAVLVPASGASVVPADLAAAVAVQGIPEVERVDIGYRIRGWKPTIGSLRSMVEIVGGGARVVTGGEIRTVPFGHRLRRLPGGLGTTFPSPDPLSISRYCPAERIEVNVVSLGAPLLCLLLPALAWGISRPPVHRRLRSALGRASMADDGRPHGRFDMTVTATGGTGRRTVAVSGSDVYGFTARAALAVARGIPGYAGPAGVRAPSEILGDPEAAARLLGLDLRIASGS